MRRILARSPLLPIMLLSFTGCSGISSKSGSLSTIYGVAVVLSLLLLIGYFCIAPKKSPWFLVLFSSVLIVNVGYYALSLSGDLRGALIANRIAYLGSVFLPLSMWMIIMKETKNRFPIWASGLLVGIGVIVFLIAASPGYSGVYYKEVYFQKINGVTVLDKVYGPLHGVYMVYLLSYFCSMVVTIVRAAVKKKVDSISYVAILAVAVFVNIGVWLIEQLVRIDFEFLSISYIISESFLLGLHLFAAETEKQKAQLLQETPIIAPSPQSEQSSLDPADKAQLDLFAAGLSRLTPKEQMIYDCYVAGMSTVQILEQLNIKENTLKFHNKNLYSKLGVSSRKQLLRFSALYKHTEELT